MLQSPSKHNTSITDDGLQGDFGFDACAGKTWIYPTNYPIREYQYTITEQALYENTLVSLPTGLGKTFIAAVVMYNFYRWYPNGKVIFIAPTKPLVKQQIDACYNIMAIPPDTTAELTGSKERTSRHDIWNSKRVFFVTAQVLQNDLNAWSELGPAIRCIVFDEAHKARGNHAYCEVMKRLKLKNSTFRVLALSATPGSRVDDVQEVISKLCISRIAFRTDESPDVSPYIHKRVIETIVVPLGEKLQQVKDTYVNILEQYTRCLIQNKVLMGNCSMWTKGKIFMALKNYQERFKNSRASNYNEIVKNLNICITLYHGYELLIRHGLRSFLTFFEEHKDKPLLRGNYELPKIMEDVRGWLNSPTLPVCEQLPDGTFTEVPKDIKFGHPKFYKLREILVSYFSSAETTTRAMVFFEYRESVKEAFTLLMQSQPLIKPRVFLGQGLGVTQKQQMLVVKAFREGQCNTLLSTCIGEEGFDVGEVDMIICFDISTKSPIRMIQRMGRTGRKRKGSVTVLVTEGREQSTLQECLAQRNSFKPDVAVFPALADSLFKDCPRMIPAHISPKCEKIYITVKKEPQVNSSKKNKSIKDMFKSTITEILNHELDECDQYKEFNAIKERIQKPVFFWNKKDPLSSCYEPSFCKNIEKQRSLQPFGEVKHSTHSETLVALLQVADSKRFNIPLTQGLAVKNLKQGDIRNIFQKSWSKSKEILSQNDGKFSADSADCKSTFESDLSEEIFTEITDYISIRQTLDLKCGTCENLFPCPKWSGSNSKTSPFNDWNQPQISVLDSLSYETLEEFSKKYVTIKLRPGYNDLLSFFKLKSVADVFETNRPIDEIPNNYSSVNVLDCDLIEIPSPPSSPILNSFDKIQVQKNKEALSQSQKRTINPATVLQNETEVNFNYSEDNISLVSPHLSPLKKNGITALFNTENGKKLTAREESVTKKATIVKKQINEMSLQEVCDMSFFNLDSNVENKQSQNKDKVSKNIDLDDIFDMSFFNTNDSNKNSSPKKKADHPEYGNRTQASGTGTISNKKKKIDLKEFCDMSSFGLDSDFCDKNFTQTVKKSIENKAKRKCNFSTNEVPNKKTKKDSTLENKSNSGDTSMTITQMVDFINKR